MPMSREGTAVISAPSLVYMGSSKSQGCQDQKGAASNPSCPAQADWWVEEDRTPGPSALRVLP